MKLIIEIVLSMLLHPVAMVLMWINLAGRRDLDRTRKVIWFIVSIVWGLGPILYIVIQEGSFW